jgi:pimeloyl-ACP methyl ester carboxylesterase
VDIVQTRARVQDIELNVATCGPETGRPVILLHGFPEYWRAWHRQIPRLAAAGRRVIVPDQRGVNESDKPKGIDAYRLDTLVGDVLALADQFGAEPLDLVGHDWGAAVAWWLAVRHPERLRRLVIINLPHPFVFRRYMFRHPSQLMKSWYMMLFQLPWIPEKIFLHNRAARAIRGFEETSQPGTFSSEELEGYRRAWTQPRAMTASINWYRAAFLRPPKIPENLRIRPRTLVIWGKRDKFLEFPLVPATMEYCDDAQLEVLEDAGHWVHHEEPERVSQLILEHIEA